MRPPFRLFLYAILLIGCIVLIVGNVAAGDSQDASAVGKPLNLDDALYQTNKTSPVPIRSAEELRRLRDLGETIARAGSKAGAAPCAQCHGMDGAGDTSGAFPRIAGLSVYYAAKQLGDYAASARPNDIMTPLAQKLSPEEMEAVSVYYGEKAAALVHYNGFEPREILWGQTIATMGLPQAGLAPCESCHDGASTRYPYSAPLLAGQYASYAALQLDLWRRGVRGNDVGNVMSHIAGALPKDAARAVSKYYEALTSGMATKSALSQRQEAAP